MKQKSLIYTLALASSLVFLTACGGGSDKEAEEIVKEDDPKDQEPSEVLETMLLDCNSGVPQAETLTLTNRNDTVDYKVDCSYQVSGDLIIEPDVVVEFASESGLHVRGSVQAKGTEVLPVTLTGTSKAAGAQKGVFIDSAHVLNELSNVKIEYAGSGSFNSNGDEGAVIIYTNALLTMKDSVISDSKSYGINASYSGATLDLRDNTIVGSDIPIIMDGIYANGLKGGTFEDNRIEAIVINSDDISGEHTWTDLGIPYRISNRLQIIPNSGKLTINPGVVVVFESDGQLIINEGASGQPPSLVAVGTKEDPILFTGVNKVLGAWKGIYFDSPNALNEIGHATIEYASNTSQKGAIEVWADTILNLHDITFKHISRCAINGENSGYLDGVTRTNLSYGDEVVFAICENDVLLGDN